MKPLNQGEKEIFTISAKSKYGDGEAIVSNFGVAIHTKKTGAILDLLYPEIIGMEDLGGGKLRILWKEESGKNNSLKIITRESDQAHERICAARTEFERSFPKHGTALNGPIGSPLPSQNRSKKVPASIPDEFVWHDCWYDAARRLYVTLNPYFVHNDNLRKRQHQIEYQERTGDLEGIVAKKEKIRMVAGCPSVQIVKNGKSFYMLLPSLTHDMVTAEIAAARHAPAAGQQRIDYFLID